MKVNPALKNKFRGVRLVVMDVDGTLTDGRMLIGSGGEELKAFSSRDGIRMSLAARAGLPICLFTGRPSKAIEVRAKNVDAAALWYKSNLKEDLYDTIKKQFRVLAREVMYVGDDLVDLGFMKRAGLAVAPADAAPEVKKVAHYVTNAKGGEGVAAEIVELILKAQGKWDKMIEAVSYDYRLLA